MSAVTNLHDLFVEHLKDIYYAEKKILKALPKMCKALDDDSPLCAAFEAHRAETEGQVERLEEVFNLIGEKPKGKTCPAIDGLTEEADELIKEVECMATLEAGLLAGAQAVEHYEIARYGALVEWAKTMGHDEAAELLEETLAEEKKTDQILNRLAIRNINKRAMEAQEASNDNEDDEEEEETSARKRRA